MPKRYILSDEGGFGDEDSALDEEPGSDLDDIVMLPPTVSTYSHRVQYIPPPPDSESLREDLKRSLSEADNALKEVDVSKSEESDTLKYHDEDQEYLQDLTQEAAPASGWHEIQGLHILDVVTQAIRAAKVYYTSHEHPKRLYTIKSERKIREELLSVMDVLKRMASRNFAGCMKADELATIRKWVEGIEILIAEAYVFYCIEDEYLGKFEWLDGGFGGARG